MAKRVLILGGTGAMGVPLTQLLGSKGFRVYVTSRKSRQSIDTITYLKGSAKDDDFLKNIFALSDWDAVIDFMSYSTQEFKARYELLLSGTKQYVFISSARVYSRSEVPITEDTPRLLDVCNDSTYLKTDEYALAKARCEDLLTSSGLSNWTIIRPSITYNTDRLQLGVLEKEGVFYRALHGRSIVFSRDIADKITTMTWGQDVAEGIAAVIGQPEALAQVFHITEPHSYKWQEILDVYVDVLSKKLGRKPGVVMTDKAVSFKCGNKYQIIYCRYFNRSFDNSRISRFVNQADFIDAKEGVRRCLEEFLECPRFNVINWRLEALNDLAAGERTPLSEIDNIKGKLVYLASRHHMDLMTSTARRLKHMLGKIRNLRKGGGGYSRIILGSGVSSPKTMEELKPLVLSALEHGINRFDTAPSYRTEHTLGAALKSSASELGLSRKDYYVQTKIDAWQMIERDITKHVDDALRKLDSEYLDSLLIHWPVPEEMTRTWEQMTRLKHSGLVKNIGICNVRMRQLKKIALYDVKPDVIQLERNPLRTCESESSFCLENDIELQSYSPLCKMHPKLRDNASVHEIANRYRKTPGQVLLRWNIDTGAVPIFATHKPERIEEYSDVMSFTLLPEDVRKISSLNCNYKMYLESFACPGF